jgi:hypothetical protein
MAVTTLTVFYVVTFCVLLVVMTECCISRRPQLTNGDFDSITYVNQKVNLQKMFEYNS